MTHDGDNCEEVRSKKPRLPATTSELDVLSSEKLKLSRAQTIRRRRKTLEVLRPVHCGTKKVLNQPDKPVMDGMWTTLINAAPKQCMKEYISKSKTCTDSIIPQLVKTNIHEYENSLRNKVRSMRVLYEGGLISKKKYTYIRNATDVVRESGKNSKNKKTEFMKNCEIPKIVPYKSLTSFIQSIDIGEMISLETLAARLNVDAFPGVYRPLKPFLLKLADLYLFLDEKVPCLHRFNGEKDVLYIAIGADGAPFGRDDTATGNYVIILLYNTFDDDDDKQVVWDSCYIPFANFWHQNT